MNTKRIVKKLREARGLFYKDVARTCELLDEVIEELKAAQQTLALDVADSAASQSESAGEVLSRPETDSALPRHQ